MPNMSEDLADFHWPDKLQDLQDTLNRAYGIPVLIVRPTGRPLTACEDLSRFCRRFTRSISLSRPCLECGREVPTSLHPLLDPMRSRNLLRHCPLGLVDITAPICAAGEALGYLVSAQIRLSDERRIIEPAKSKRGELESCEQFTLQCPVISRGEIAKIAYGFSAIAWVMGETLSTRRRNYRLAERLREQSKFLRENAINDPLTGVLNMRRFNEVLDLEVRRVRRYRRAMSLLYIEVIGCREICQEFGYETIGGILSSVAQCLTSNFRQTDMVGRVSENAFGVIMPETARHQALVAVVRVENKIEELNISGEFPVEILLAIGIVDEIDDPNEMLSNVLRVAKRTQVKEISEVPAWKELWHDSPSLLSITPDNLADPR